MTQQDEDTFASEAFDVLIITMSAWRRLRSSIEETGKKNPKNGAIAIMLLALMDATYQQAAAELADHKKSLKDNLEKARKNTKYGKVGE